MRSHDEEPRELLPEERSLSLKERPRQLQAASRPRTDARPGEQVFVGFLCGICGGHPPLRPPPPR